MTRPNTLETIAARLENEVARIPESGCHLWLGSLDNTGGYGCLKIHQRRTRLHRLAWIIKNGPIPDGLCILHKCDIPCCVNPYHLFLGTNAENTYDKTRKGRQAKGSQNGRAKLTEQQVIAIRSDPRSHRAVSEEYGVSAVLIGLIRNGKNWNHV